MQKDRYMLFLFLSLGTYLLWAAFILPLISPPAKPKGVANNPAAEAAAEPAAIKGVEEPAAPAEAGKEAVKAEEPKAAVTDLKLPSHPHQEVVLGDLDRDSKKYRMQVTLDSRGASVSQIQFSSYKYRDSQPPYGPLKLLKDDPLASRTLEMGIPELDIEFEKLGPGLNSRTLDWEVVPGSQSPSGVEFRLKSPDGGVEVFKKYELQTVPENAGELDGTGYGLKFTIRIRNASEKETKLKYSLTGPVGLVIENPFYTREYQNISVGFDNGDQSVTPKALRVEEVLKLIEKPETGREVWSKALKYVGVSVQYFTALVLPLDQKSDQPYLASTTPRLVRKDPKDPNHSDITVEMTSVELALPGGNKPGSEVAHQYLLFAGPKRPEYLQPLNAEGVINYGMSGALYITQFMHGYLRFLHGLFPAWAWPWGWAIILLTVTVRLCMLPLSLKQARSAARMQELQPEMAALKKKYADDKEKFAREQWDLFRRNKVNPLGGCLPLLVQFPIFIGLYQALSISVDLRMAEFLWIKNLAAPDALFRFPFVITGIPLPIFGSVFALGPTFNLLPLLTVGLFLVQQKLFMPPAVDEEQKLQQKMMTYMMLLMGLMFYGVPAGLCVYFIASSIWSIVERKSLPKAIRPAMAGAGTTEPTIANGSTGNTPPTKPTAPTNKTPGPPKKENLANRLLTWADNVSKQSNAPPNKGNNKKKKS